MADNLQKNAENQKKKSNSENAKTRYRKAPSNLSEKTVKKPVLNKKTSPKAKKPNDHIEKKKSSAPKSEKRTRTQKPPKNLNPLRITPLGGLGEIGKNITLYEYGDDMFLVDCGMSFPDEEMPGIDIVIPDFSYVVKNIDKI